MRLPAGKLKTLVEIQQASESTAALGQVAKTWTTVKQAWARIQPLYGKEKIAAQSIQAKRTHTITLRYIAMPSLTAEHRIKVGTAIYELAGPPIDIEQAHVAWQCECSEVTA